MPLIYLEPHGRLGGLCVWGGEGGASSPGRVPLPPCARLAPGSARAGSRASPGPLSLLLGP